jgi:trimeric autotransporter adhesin
LISFFLFVGIAAQAQVPTIATYAGGGLPTAGPATTTGVSLVGGIGLDPAGNLYFVSYTGTILKVNPAGTLSVYAGTGPCCLSGDGGPATSAMLGIMPEIPPAALKTDPTGNVYLVDDIANVVRRIDHVTGIITTVAGTPNSTGFGGSGGLATSAQISPAGLAFDAAGDLFISDYNSVVWRVDHATQIITIVAGNGTAGYSGDGGPATAAELSYPLGMVVDGSGDLFIADSNNGRVRRVDAATQVITTVAGGGNTYPPTGVLATQAQLASPSGLAFDPAGDLLIADPVLPAVLSVSATTQDITVIAGNFTLGPGFSGDGGPATSAQLGLYSLGAGMDLGVDAAGDIFLTDTVNYRVRRIAASTGVITTVAGNGGVGDGGPATNALLFTSGLVHDNSGDVFITDTVNGRVRRVDASTGLISTVAGTDVESTPPPSGNGGPATAAQLSTPGGLARDSSGDLFFAGGNVIREVAGSTGIINVFAGTGSAGFSGDGGPATDARLNDPRGLATDAAGDVFIADRLNNVVRRVDAATNVITTVAGNTSILTNGVPTAGYSGDGGPATSAQLSSPRAVFLDAAGNLYIADSLNNVIRRVDAVTGIITTVAGNHSLGPGFSGDNGPALSAQFSGPSGLALDAFGNLYISDQGNYRVRQVNAVTGIITTLAGDGALTFGGDGGPAASASLWPYLSGMTILPPDASGNIAVLVMDGTSGRTRVITIPPVPAIFLSPTGLTFAGLAVGQSSAPQLVTIADSGTGTLDVADIAVTGTDAADFALSPGGTCAGTSFELAPTASCTIAVTFTPESEGEQSATVTINDNSSGSPHTVALQGNGLQALVSVSPNPVTFPGQLVGTISAAIPVTITNVGNATLFISTISTTADFAETDNCVGTSGIAPSHFCTISVTFMPAVPGIVQGSLTITSNAAGSPQAVPLQGTGTFPSSQTITQPISPTAANQFNFVTHTFGVQYPPGTSFSNVDMSVTATQTSEATFQQRVAGTTFAGATCIQYTGGECVDYAVTCTNTSGNSVTCPSESTPSISVKTSYDTTQSIVNPGFLTAPIGTNNWTNIFDSFYLQRIDPTTKGRTTGFSEFVAVALGATNAQGQGTFAFLAPLQQSDKRIFPAGIPIPVEFKLMSLTRPGTPVTDATAGITVTMISNASGNPTSTIVLEKPSAFTYVHGRYVYLLNTEQYAPGVYNLTVYGNAFPAQQVQFTLPVSTSRVRLETTLQSLTVDSSANQYVAVLNVTNSSSVEANGVVVILSALNLAPTSTILPYSLGDISPGGSATVTLTYSTAAGREGYPAVLTVREAFAGGSTPVVVRVKLP